MNENFSFKDYAKFLNSLSANQLTFFGCAIGLILSQGLDPDEAASLGNFFELVGQAMLTYGSQEQLIQDNKKNKT